MFAMNRESVQKTGRCSQWVRVWSAKSHVKTPIRIETDQSLFDVLQRLKKTLHESRPYHVVYI